MTTTYFARFNARHPRTATFVAGAGTLSLATLIVMFGWNNFAVTIFELARLQFKEALALTLLLAVIGRLIAPIHGARRPHGWTP